MFLLLATYTKPAEEVDRHLEDHKAWIGRYTQSGNILLTARQVPLTGGLVIATGESAEAMWEMIREDPFYTSGCAEYDVREYAPVRAAAGVEGLLGT